MKFKVLYHTIFYSFIILLFIGCFNKKDKSDEELATIDTEGESLIQDETLLEIDSTAIGDKESFFDDSEPFYPLQETIEDIQLEMADLRAKILDYESRIKNQDNSLEALHKIQFPH